MKAIVHAVLLLPVFAWSQKLVENKIDEFTKASVKRTDYERLTYSTHLVMNTRASKIDSTYFLDIKAFGAGSFAVNEGNKLMLKLDDSDVIIFNNLKFQVTCTGCGAVGINGSGAQGIALSFRMPDSAVATLIAHPIAKLRLYTNDGYVEEDIKVKFASMFQKNLQLLQ